MRFVKLTSKTITVPFVVFSGLFDGRNVAVKRVVSEFMNLAEREVDLLRESDSHANVVRYYCTAADSQFR